MWCRGDIMAVIVPVILAGSIHTSEGFGGISSFRKTQTDPTKPPTPATAPARVCARPADCVAVSSSSCVRTRYDSQTRCLCGDNSVPVNGECESKTKTLYHSCTNSEECNDGLSCGTPNATGGLPPHLRMFRPRDTICLCDVENGFREEDYTCTGQTVPGKVCSRPADCIAVSSSSCVRTRYDSQTRCLCGDNSVPVNGECESKTKTLYHSCTNSEECNDGLFCGIPNVTLGPHLRMFSPRDTICLCDEDNGSREENYTCSDADILKTSVITVVVVSCIRKMLVYY